MRQQQRWPRLDLRTSARAIPFRRKLPVSGGGSPKPTPRSERCRLGLPISSPISRPGRRVPSPHDYPIDGGMLRKSAAYPVDRDLGGWRGEDRAVSCDPYPAKEPTVLWTCAATADSPPPAAHTKCVMPARSQSARKSGAGSTRSRSIWATGRSSSAGSPTRNEGGPSPGRSRPLGRS